MGEGRGGGGVWDPKVCVPKMARSDFPDCKFRFFPRWSLWSGEGGGGAPPPPVTLGWGMGSRGVGGEHRCHGWAVSSVWVRDSPPPPPLPALRAHLLTVAKNYIPIQAGGWGFAVHPARPPPPHGGRS